MRRLHTYIRGCALLREHLVMTAIQVCNFFLILIVASFALAVFSSQVHAAPATITAEDLESVSAPLNPVLSPDGNQFAIVRNGQIALFPSEGGWPVTLTSTPGGKSEISW